MSYGLTGARGRATTRSFKLVGARGRAAVSRSFELVGARGRAAAPPALGGTFELVGARGRVVPVSATTTQSASPFELVTLPPGTWAQVAGPVVDVNAAMQFVAPAQPDGVDVRFQSPDGLQVFDVSVFPHTVFRMSGGQLVPVFVSPVSAPVPAVVGVTPPPPPDPTPIPDPGTDAPPPTPTPDPTPVTPDPGTDTTYLPFNLPTVESLQASAAARGVLTAAHPMGGMWVTPQQPADNTVADYWDINYLYYPPNNQSFSGLTSSGSTITHTATPLVNGDVLFFTATGGATGVTVGAVYYVVGKATNSFQVSATSGGAPITLGSTVGLAITKSTLRNLYGGECRDRYARRPIRPEASGTWQVLDIEWEIRAAQSAGINAFTWGTATRNGIEWTRLQYALKAASNHNAKYPTRPFHIIPWVLNLSSISGTPATETPTQSGQILADLFSGLINDPAYAKGFRKRNNRVLFMPYAPNEAQAGNGSSITPAAGVVTSGMEFYQALDARMTANGTPADWYMCFQSNFTGLAAGFESVGAGMGHFGSRDYNTTAGSGTSYGGARTWIQNTMGFTYRNAASPPMPYIAPISTQAFVPRGTPTQVGGNGIMWESGGTLNLENSCLSASNQLDPTGWNIVNINTWNDFTEGSSMAPSKGSGFHWLDLWSWHMVKMVTGSYPTIVRDGLYLTHRKQKTSGVTYTSVQKKFVVQAGTPSGSPTTYTGTNWIDILDVVVYLTAPATVEVTSGTNAPVSFTLAAGRNRVTVPLGNGTQSARILRGGTPTGTAVTSPITVSATQLVQDLMYYGCSSFAGVARPVPVIAD